MWSTRTCLETPVGRPPDLTSQSAPPSFRNIHLNLPIFFSSISYSWMLDEAAASTASDLGFPVKNECCTPKADRKRWEIQRPCSCTVPSFSCRRVLTRGTRESGQRSTFRYPWPSSVLALALLLRRETMLGSRDAGACLSTETAVSSDVDLAATRSPCRSDIIDERLRGAGGRPLGAPPGCLWASRGGERAAFDGSEVFGPLAPCVSSQRAVQPSNAWAPASPPRFAAALTAAPDQPGEHLIRARHAVMVHF